LINAFGKKLHHTIVSARHDELSAAQLISSSVAANFPKEFPSLSGWSTPGRLLALARAMQSYDLILTYGWGAMSAAMAHTVFGQAMNLPPLIHHEGGFDADEVSKLKAGRNWYRRIALGRASGLVVPSERIEGIALTTWYQPIGRVKTIADGIETKAFGRTCRPDALRGVVKRAGERWVGTTADIVDANRLPQLVQAFSKLPDEWQLVILGDGPDKDSVRDIASNLEISHRIHMPGKPRDPANVMGLFDIYAATSPGAQFPVDILHAMAAGIPITGNDVGDIAEMVSDANKPFIVKSCDADALGRAMQELFGMVGHGKKIGQENQAKARASYDEKTMIESYRRLYASALGREI
jgi:glycosyltransferase involved in cell wall biosynthesis